MPDADDFDVEYFRSLLKGGAKEEPRAPAAVPAPENKGGKRPAAKPSAAPGKGMPQAGRKKKPSR